MRHVSGVYWSFEDKVANIDQANYATAAAAAPTRGMPSIDPSKVPGEGTFKPDPAFESP